jgi:phenylpropionate dioxygenase-like ring-hydroxylating dioxygenase large terminal subunit
MARTVAGIAANDIQSDKRGPGKPLQKVFDGDTIAVPEPFRENSHVQMGSRDVPIERYISSDWHAAEVEKVWRKTWQVACRAEEIAEVGDYVVYDIVDDSLIVVRTAPDEIRAYYNACLHRANALCLENGKAKAFRCPFHGFTWSLEGELLHIPSQWDFEHVPKDEFDLPQAHVDQWGGFVFVNMDPECGSLREYLEILPDHLDCWNFEDRYKAVHVSKVLPCNWKIAQEAFIEGYHVSETHYEKDHNGNIDPNGIAAMTDEVMMQYDTWPESRHVTRMILASGVQSHNIEAYGKPEQHVIDTMLRHVPADQRPQLEPGESARGALAEYNRGALGSRYGVDLSERSDTDVLDQVEYTLFPNFTFWPTLFAPLLYRFRPNGNCVDESIMEVYMLHPIPEDGRDYQPMAERRLGLDEDWASVAELGGYGPILDQDTPNMRRMTKGLKTTRKPGITLGNYQEGRIRHFHRTLDEYLHEPD